MNVLLSEKRLRSPREAMVLLKNSEDSKLFLFAGLGTQSIFNSIKSMVTSIASEKAPKFDSATDTEGTADMANKALVGEKLGMTQIWTDDNVVVTQIFNRKRKFRNRKSILAQKLWKIIFRQLLLWTSTG